MPPQGAGRVFAHLFLFMEDDMHPLISYREEYRLVQKMRMGQRPMPEKRASGPLSRFLSGALDGWKRRKMVASLSALDDRILADIGLQRDDIARVVEDFAADEARAQKPYAPRRAAGLKQAA